MIPGFGNYFFVISMLFDKVMMIISRFGGLILTLFISFILSAYLYFLIEFNFESLINYKLLSRPEPVVKYFIAYLKHYYYNRATLPMSATFKIFFVLVTPYATIKLLKVAFSFFLFVFAMKLQHRIPTISSYILRKVNVNPYLMNQISNQRNKKIDQMRSQNNNHNHAQTNTQNNQFNSNINPNNKKEKINLRK
jgi:hypothetical protein